MRLALTLRD